MQKLILLMRTIICQAITIFHLAAIVMVLVLLLIMLFHVLISGIKIQTKQVLNVKLLLPIFP